MRAVEDYDAVIIGARFATGLAAASQLQGAGNDAERRGPWRSQHVAHGALLRPDGDGRRGTGFAAALIAINPPHPSHTASVLPGSAPPASTSPSDSTPRPRATCAGRSFSSPVDVGVRTSSSGFDAAWSTPAPSAYRSAPTRRVPTADLDAGATGCSSSAAADAT